MDASKIKLVVALGNPGKKYAQTRHNIAWLLLESLPFYSDLQWKKKFKGQVAEWQNLGLGQSGKIYFLKPETYMNLSGESVVSARKFYSLENSEILVIHDEIDLTFGKLVLKSKGGTGGHNGLRSMVNSLGGNDFYRMRLGIAGEHAKANVSSYVLSPFNSEEKGQLPTFLEHSGKCLEMILQDGFSKASCEYSQKILL